MSGAADFKQPVAALVEGWEQQRADFRVAVTATDGRCLAHDDPADCAGAIEAHHVITQQQLRRARRFDLLWDPANGMTLCDDAHDQHHLAVARIPFERLPARCVAFARLHGFDLILERVYPRAS